MSRPLRRTLAALATAATTATAVVALSPTAALADAPTIEQYTVAFTGTSISAATSTSAWVAGTTAAPEEPNGIGTVRVARVENRALVQDDLGIEGARPSVVATGSREAWLLPTTLSWWEPGMPVAPLWHWAGSAWTVSEAPTTATLPTGEQLTLVDIKGNPRDGMQGLFMTGILADPLSSVVRVGRWNGSGWDLSDKKVCDMGTAEALSPTLASAPDGWLALCFDMDATWRVDSSSTYAQLVSGFPGRAPATAITSAGDFWVFGSRLDAEAGWQPTCERRVDGFPTACAAPPEEITDATVNTYGSVYVAGDAAFYRFDPVGGRYETVASGPASGAPTHLASSPYGPQVWAVNGSTVYAGS